MNHVTRGLGKRSGMLATGGLGRRVIFILELAAQYYASAGRVWATTVDSRPWMATALDRVWEGVARGRNAGVVATRRTYAAFTDARSWLVRKVRPWKGDSDRSWSDDA